MLQLYLYMYLLNLCIYWNLLWFIILFKWNVFISIGFIAHVYLFIYLFIFIGLDLIFFYSIHVL